MSHLTFNWADVVHGLVTYGFFCLGRYIGWKRGLRGEKSWFGLH